MSAISGLPPGPNGPSAPGRDRFLDVVRCFALAAVVFNHFVFPLYFWDPRGGTFHMIQEIGQGWVTWPFVWELPAFFFVGGAVIRSSALKMPYGKFVAKRVWRLAVPAVACFVTGLLVEGIGKLMDVPACHPGSGPLMGFLPLYPNCAAGLWVGPLWFMMVFIPLTLLSPVLARWYRPGRQWMWIVGVLALVGVSDLNFYGGGSALPTSELVWLLPWLLGFSYADGSLQRLGRSKLVAWGLGAGVMMIVGIAFGPWTSVLGRFPRTLETAFEALVSVPLLVAFRVGVARLGDAGPGAWLVKVIGPRMMSIYVWHQPAQALVVVVAAATQLGLAQELGWRWGLEKVPWVAACLVVMWGLLRIVEPLEQIPAPSWLGGRGRRGVPDPADIEVRPS